MTPWRNTEPLNHSAAPAEHNDALQIHSWGQSFDNQSPNLEFIAPSTVYTVVAGERTYLNLSSIPQLTPRQIRVLSSPAASQEPSTVDSNLDEVPL